jgi:hypothetical protein
MPLDYQFSGPPGVLESPSDGLGLGADTFNNCLYLISQNGNVPLTGSVVAKAVAKAQTTNLTNLLTYTAYATGLYELQSYVVSTVNTSGTLPAVTAVWTESDNGGTAITTTLGATGSSSATNTIVEGRYVVNVAAGSTIVFATTSVASLTYNVKVRVAYLG